jgi:hypothetical protein
MVDKTARQAAHKREGNKADGEFGCFLVSLVSFPPSQGLWRDRFVTFCEYPFSVLPLRPPATLRVALRAGPLREI